MNQEIPKAHIINDSSQNTGLMVEIVVSFQSE
jgi:hypothetical protein